MAKTVQTFVLEYTGIDGSSKTKTLKNPTSGISGDLLRQVKSTFEGVGLGLVDGYYLTTQTGDKILPDEN